MLAWLRGTARSCRTAQPCRSSAAKTRAVRRSPAAPRRQATASGLGWNRSIQPAAMAASAPRTSPSRGATRLPRTPPAAPTPRTATTRHGRLRVQAAHSAARARRHCAWAEPPGQPTLVRTRTATTGRSALVPASSSSGSSPRWARMACRSAWLSGRTDPLGRSSSSKGQGRGLAIGCSFPAGLAGGPLRARPATPLVRSWLAGSLAGRLGVADAVSGALFGLDPVDGRAGPLPVGPLAWVVGLGAEGSVGIGDLVGVPVLLNLGGGLAPGPPAPGRRRHRAQRLQDKAGALLLDGQASGAALPSQGPHHLSILGAEVGVGLQPAVADVLVLAQLPLPVMSAVDLLGSHRQATRDPGRPLATSQPAKHAWGLVTGGLLIGG